MWKAKKLAIGFYQYRGYEIEQMVESSDKHWNIREIGESNWEDAAQTLKDAKELIDMWLR